MPFEGYGMDRKGRVDKSVADEGYLLAGFEADGDDPITSDPAAGRHDPGNQPVAVVHYQHLVYFLQLIDGLLRYQDRHPSAARCESGPLHIAPGRKMPCRFSKLAWTSREPVLASTCRFINSSFPFTGYRVPSSRTRSTGIAVRRRR